MIRLVKHYRRPRDQLTQDEIRSYLLHRQERGLSASSRNVAILGMKFFYNEILMWNERQLFIPPRKKTCLLVVARTPIVVNSEWFKVLLIFRAISLWRSSETTDNLKSQSNQKSKTWRVQLLQSLGSAVIWQNLSFLRFAGGKVREQFLCANKILITGFGGSLRLLSRPEAKRWDLRHWLRCMASVCRWHQQYSRWRIHSGMVSST